MTFWCFDCEDYTEDDGNYVNAVCDECGESRRCEDCGYDIDHDGECMRELHGQGVCSEEGTE